MAAARSVLDGPSSSFILSIVSKNIFLHLNRTITQLGVHRIRHRLNQSLHFQDFILGEEHIRFNFF